MSLLNEITTAIKLGGVAMIPLSLLFILAIALIFDKIFFYQKFVKLPQSLMELVETFGFSWKDFEDGLNKLEQKNCYRRFFLVILKNKSHPTWWLESRAGDEAKLIEKNLVSSLWILETIITAAPLLGLLGTIIGMMSSFKIIGVGGELNPASVTVGVAESLIATGFGLVIAVFSLFAFNYFSKKQNEVLDELERLGTRMIDHVRLDQNQI
jgi:biopolymer transport protein ExbB